MLKYKSPSVEKKVALDIWNTQAYINYLLTSSENFYLENWNSPYHLSQSKPQQKNI